MKIYDTKLKGDIGVTQVIAHATKNGYYCALPISEHLPFDIILINQKGIMKRTSVKFCSISNGVISIPLRSISTNTKATKISLINFDDIDIISAYCPDNDKIYFVNSNDFKHLKSELRLRINEPLKTGGAEIRYAKDFENLNNIF